MFIKILVSLPGGGTCNYYSELPVDTGDSIVATTKYGIITGTVLSASPVSDKNYDPFKDGRAKQHVLENTTKKLYNKENVIMFGSKTVEVQHLNSNRKNIFYTDLDLAIGQIVVYDANPPMDKEGTVADLQSLHVGVVTNNDPDCVTANAWIVDVVQLGAYSDRIQRVKEANKLRQKLNAKRKQYQEFELLKLIAQNDPETAAMLEAYQKLTNT